MNFKGYVLSYYRNEMKQEILSFKNNDQYSVSRWCKFVESTDLDQIKDVDYVVRALGSNEMSAKFRTPLDEVANTLAIRFNASYTPNILHKLITSQLKFAGNSVNRKRILDNTYTCNYNEKEAYPTILVVDDVYTTGTTFNEIARAILKETNNKANVICLALSETLWNKDYTNSIKIKNTEIYNEYIAA